MQTTEQWCKHRSMNNAIIEAANLLNDKNVNSYGNINQLIEAAQAVSFNKDIGHNLFDNAEARWDFFNAPKYKISFGHTIFDEITDGGMSRKTLTLFLANANCGKSLVMCDIAANVLKAGQNVLCITLELSEQMVARRIESNLLNIDFHAIKDISREKYISRMNKLKMSTHGKLIVKEYPNGSASCRDFQMLLNELKRKKSFTPDLIVVDYLGIIANAVTGKDIQGHEALAAISGQLRRLAMENDVPVLSAHQLNRGSEGKTDVNASDIAGSYGIMRDPDLVLGIINTPEHRANGIIEFKQLKNRDSSTTNHARFAMNINAARMTLSDIDDGTIRTLRDVTTRTDSDEDFGNLNQKRELAFTFDDD
jgi:replicative DNA helicase